MSNQFAMKGSIKPLKGQTITSNYGVFDTVSANNLILESISIAGVFEDGILLNVTIKDSQLINTVIGAEGANIGYFTKLQTSENVTFLGDAFGSYVSWDPVNSTFVINGGTFQVNGCSYLDNIEICRNDIMATNLNGDINLSPNGLGTLYLNGPIYNKTSNGNYYSEVNQGSITFSAKNNIYFGSSAGTATINTFDSQSFTTTNGDISLITESPTSKTISLIYATTGNTAITTNLYHNLKSGDIITLSGTGLIDTNYTVGSILSNNSFLLSTSTPVSSNITKGSLIKQLNNNINLTTKSYVKIPENTKLTFGTTTNSISGNTGNLAISSYGDLYFNVPTSANIIIPQNTDLQFGTSGSNYINSDGTSTNINNANTIALNSSLTKVNSTNTRFYDPILTIADYTLTSTDNKDRGIEFRYFSTGGSMKLGWFGYKVDSNKFTLIPDATNINETIYGDPGTFDIGDISTTNIIINSGGTLNANCGSILNVKLITGCSGTININATNNLNITAGNRISLNANNDIYIPNNIPVTIGTSGSSILEETSGNLKLSSSKNVRFITQTNGSIIVPVNTNLSFDGTSVGSQKISSNTSGDLFVNTNKNLYLTTTGGNIIIPSNTSLQLGNSTETISGNTGSIKIITSSSSGTLNFIASSTAAITSSVGNILLKTFNNGDINLYTTIGNTRLQETTKLIFGISGTSNSLMTDSIGNLVIYGGNNSNLLTSGNSIDVKNVANINLSASSNVNIPTSTQLNVSSDKSKYIVSDSNNNFNIVNNSSNGTTLISSFNTNINNTSGSLSVQNINTNISTNNLTVTGTTGSSVLFNTQNVKFQDPILSIANYTTGSNDLKDRGVEFNYYSTSGTKLGWFGWKNSSSRFTYYSEAQNSGEVISGTVGSLEINSIYLNNGLSFINNGQLDMNCGTIANLNTILGCSGTVNILATNAINASSSNIMLNASSKVQLPYNVPLSFGTTSNSIISDSNGNMTITSLGGSGTLILNSNVQINGTTTNIYSTVTNLQDPIFSIGGVAGPNVNDSKDRGIEFKWNNGLSSKTGFFGYKNSLERFVFIQDGVNTNEVYSGQYGNVQFGNGYFNNLDINNGTISNVNTISGNNVNIVSNTNINLSSGNVLLPANSNLSFGTTNNTISSNTSGDLMIKSQNNTSITSQSGGIQFITSTSGNPNSYIQFPQNVPMYFGSDKSDYIIRNTSNNLQIVNSAGNIELIPKTSTGNVIIPQNTFLGFGSTSNSIASDGQQLLLNGYNGVGINTSSLTITGNVNIIGTISASVNREFDVNAYILPLGTSQILNVVSVENYSTVGNIKIKTDNINYLSPGDTVILKNTNSSPSIDNTYNISQIISSTEFLVTRGSALISSGASAGTVKSNLTTYQGKDVGIQVNYWSTTGNIGVTAGSAAYKTGFFGFKNESERWTFYRNSTISNNIVTGNLSDIEVNEVFTTRMSGFILDGGISAGSNQISGTNFQVSGGNINNTPIGVNVAQTGRFTSLSNTVSASFSNVTLNSSLAYTFERYSLSSGFPTRNPSTSYVISMFSVTSPSFTSSSGTMPSNSASIPDGTYKTLVCSSMATGSNHTIFFGTNKLITPNPLNVSSQATKLVFKRQGQSCNLIFDATANNSTGSWILIAGGSVYVQ